MGAGEFTEWKAFAEVEPIGARRADMQTAQICATIANSQRSKKQKAFKVSQFIPDYWQADTDARPPWQAIKQKDLAIHTTLGGKLQ
jgi:hypothetical protein